MKDLNLLVLRLAQKSADEMMNGIRQEVLKHSKGAVQSDDITLMVIKAK